MENNSVIKPADRAFRCGICGKQVKKGEACIQEYGIRTCTCVLPARQLIATGIIRPGKRTNPTALIEDLNKSVDHLRKKNLKMRLEIEVLTTLPHGTAAQKIIERYRRENVRLLQKDANRIHMDI